MEAARGGHEGALATLVKRHRERLERRVELRMARRLLGRVDPADGVQESYLALRGKSPQHSADPPLPCFLWLRLEVGQKLVDVHRFHLGAQMRDAGQGSRCTRGCCRR
jgi:RNA polymerase sigma-70 factor (ECF subfamily)